MLMLGVVVLLFVLLFGPGPAPAAASEYRLFDRVSVVAGGFFESTDTRIRVAGSVAGLSDSIDFEPDLGLDGSDTLLRLRVEYRPWKRHQFSAGYYRLDRDATRVIDREIEFGDQVFPIHAELSSFVDFEFLEVSYTYWILMKDRLGFGGSFGLVEVGVDAGLALSALGGQAQIQQSASTDLPVPLIGLEVRYGILEKLILLGYGQLLPSVKVGDVEGSVYNLSAALEYRAFKAVGFGAAFNAFDIDVDVDKRGFHGTVDYQIQGVQLYLRAGF